MLTPLSNVQQTTSFFILSATHLHTKACDSRLERVQRPSTNHESIAMLAPPLRSTQKRLVVFLASVVLALLFADGLLAQTHVYWIAYNYDDDTGRVVRAGLDGSNPVPITASSADAAFDIAFDIVSGKMYLSLNNDDSDTGQIVRANLDGSNYEGFPQTVDASPTALAVDPLGRKLYWSEWYENEEGNTKGRIKRSNLDGSAQETIVTGEMEGSWDISVDPVAGKLYWADVDLGIFEESTGKIERSNLDGTGRETLNTGTTDVCFGIALDAAAGKLYWAGNDEASETGRIQRANLDGSSAQMLVPGLGFLIGLTLDTANGKMYWTEGIESADGSRTSYIKRANLDGSAIETLVTSSQETFFGIEMGPYAAGTPVEYAEVPQSTDIYLQNHPNPFQIQTTIEYRLPEAGQVGLAVYDLLGRSVKTLVDGNRSAGLHRVPFAADQLPPGVYLSVLTVDSHRKVTRMVVK